MSIVINTLGFFCLIAEAKTGVFYTNQTGGHACNAPKVEGFMIPLRDEDYDYGQKQIGEHKGAFSATDILHDYFSKVPGKHQGWCCNGIDEEDAIFIEEVLDKHIFKKYHYSKGRIEVCRDMLNHCQEAWIHVTVIELSPFGQASGRLFGEKILENNKAILTWVNSD